MSHEEFTKFMMVTSLIGTILLPFIAYLIPKLFDQGIIIAFSWEFVLFCIFVFFLDFLICFSNFREYYLKYEKIKFWKNILEPAKKESYLKRLLKISITSAFGFCLYSGTVGILLCLIAITAWILFQKFILSVGIMLIIGELMAAYSLVIVLKKANE